MDLLKMNNNIEEDYVSFETAKLLHDKGFKNKNCLFSYVKDGILCCVTNLHWYYGTPNIIDAPTIQMAMKWLRIKHDIVCAVGLFTDLPKTPPYWSFNILNQSTANVMYEAFDVKCETYEEAAEASIKYCLENLV